VRKPTENDANEQRVLLNLLPQKEEETEKEKEETGCKNYDNKYGS